MSKPYFSRRTIRESKPIIEYEQDIVNDWTGTSGGTQIRVKTIEITYAQ